MTKRIIAAATFLALLCITGLAESIQIDSEHFPDQNFRTYIVQIADENEDGYLSDAERMDVMRVDVSGSRVRSVKGIEFLPNLTELQISDNPVSELDLSGNANLDCLVALGTNLSTVDLGGCELAQSAGKYQIEKDLDGVVYWANAELWVDKSVTVTDGDKILYIPDMFPFLYVNPFEMLFEDDYEPAQYAADVVIKDTETYSDTALIRPVGTIPANTAVLVAPEYGVRGEDWTITNGENTYCEILNYGDTPVYVKPSALWSNYVINPSWKYTTFPKGKTLYQRPDWNSTSVELDRESAVAIISEKDGWLLALVDRGDVDPYVEVKRVLTMTNSVYATIRIKRLHSQKVFGPLLIPLLISGVKCRH